MYDKRGIRHNDMITWDAPGEVQDIRCVWGWNYLLASYYVRPTPFRLRTKQNISRPRI